MDTVQPRIALILWEPLKPLLDDLRELFHHARNLPVDFLFLGHHALSGPTVGMHVFINHSTMARPKIASLIQGSDRRSIGRADEVAQLVLREPRRFRELIECLWNENPVLRMRAADAAEKVSAEKPRLLDRYKAELLGLLAEAKQIELRWHLALIIPRLRLTAAECKHAVVALRHYLDDRSSIVKTCALQGLADLSRNDIPMRREVKQLLEEALQSGTPAMKARARKLLKQLPD